MLIDVPLWAKTDTQDASSLHSEKYLQKDKPVEAVFPLIDDHMKADSVLLLLVFGSW